MPALTVGADCYLLYQCSDFPRAVLQDAAVEQESLLRPLSLLKYWSIQAISTFITAVVSSKLLQKAFPGPL